MSIDYGDKQNLLKNLIGNIKYIIETYQKDELGIRFRNIYEEDIQLPNDRSVAIDIENMDIELRAWNNKTIARYIAHIDVLIWLYLEEWNENARKQEAIEILWKMTNMFLQHATLNGYAPQLGCKVLGMQYMPRKLYSKVMCGGYIRLRVDKLFDITNID